VAEPLRTARRSAGRCGAFGACFTCREHSATDRSGRGSDMMWWQVVLLLLFLGTVGYYTVKVIRPPK
jgi:hypothetical protein